METSNINSHYAKAKRRESTRALINAGPISGKSVEDYFPEDLLKAYLGLSPKQKAFIKALVSVGGDRRIAAGTLRTTDYSSHPLTRWRWRKENATFKAIEQYAIDHPLLIGDAELVATYPILVGEVLKQAQDETLSPMIRQRAAVEGMKMINARTKKSSPSILFVNVNIPKTFAAMSLLSDVIEGEVVLPEVNDGDK